MSLLLAENPPASTSTGPTKTNVRFISYVVVLKRSHGFVLSFVSATPCAAWR